MVRGPLDSKVMAVEETIILPGRDKLSPVVVVVVNDPTEHLLTFNFNLQTSV